MERKNDKLIMEDGEWIMNKGKKKKIVIFRNVRGSRCLVGLEGPH